MYIPITNISLDTFIDHVAPIAYRCVAEPSQWFWMVNDYSGFLIHNYCNKVI